MLENKGFDETFGRNSPAPYLAWTLPQMGALIPNYYGVTHQSNANYVAMVSGQGANPANQADCLDYFNLVPGTIGADGQAMGTGCVFPRPVKTVADQLSAAGDTWKGYMEDMGNAKGQPKDCRHPPINSPDNTQKARVGDQYAARHNPFVYFHSLLDSGACARDDVPLSQLQHDLRSAASTPNYAFITPNLCDDGHDAPCVDGRAGGLRSVGTFLRRWVPLILRAPAYRHGGLLLITFDESDGSDASACCNEPQFPNTPNNGGEYRGRGGGRVGAVALSPYIDPGTIDETAYNHFSLLRSVENIFGLPHLGFAAQSGLVAFGPDLFTCYTPHTPRAHRGRLPLHSEIKLAVIGEGTAGRRVLDLKLWHLGRVTVRVLLRGHHSASTIVRGRSLAPCQLLLQRLPRGHGTVTVSARAFGGVERRTLSY